VGTSSTVPPGSEQREASRLAPKLITNEREALQQLPALPVYFASSYALVKPYVQGFDANLLDAPSLQRVRMDTNWHPPAIDTNPGHLIP
jgi:hypothetical protein